MERSLLVQMKGKAPDGSDQITVMDYINATREIEWVTNRMDAPGKLKFSCVEIGSSTIPEGSSVEYTINGEKLFKGYVFTLEQKRDGEKTYTIYDQLRYLKASYAFTNMSLEQIIMRIAGDFGLKVGTLDPTGYVFPSLLKENEECIDIIFDALSQTIIQTGKIFIFYDKAGELTLTEVNKMFLTSRIGDGSLTTDYTYKRDIDSDTYNRVKLVRKNEKSGRTDVYVHEDTETIKKWGLLQYYDEVDKSLNEAQIDQMCEAYLQYYNRVLQTLKLETLGLVELRAGMIVPVQLGDIEDLASTRLLLCEKVTHKWSGEDHIMQFEVKSFDQLGGINIV